LLACLYFYTSDCLKEMMMSRRLIAVSLALLTVALLALSLPVLGQSATPAGASATVTTGKLNVRSMPTPIAEILIKIDEGDVYPIVGRNNTGKWWQLNVNGTIGWVNGTYVKAVNTDNVPVTFVDLSTTPGATVESTLDATPEATEVLCSSDVLFFNNTTPDLCATGPALRVAATAQQFENGSMFYRADTGDIYVFGNRGVTLVQSSIYANLPQPASQMPPEGRLAPDNRFGRVWANIAGVHDDLGWATSSVASYDALMQPAAFTSSGERLILIQLRSGAILGADPNTSMWYTVTGG
jgi:uncharacterized protein YraI